MGGNAKLKRYFPLVAFISEICGDDFEVVLHDAYNHENSVVAIYNGHLSGRKIGSPMTELAEKLIKEKIYEKKDFIANYEGRNRKGKRFVSSTFFIKEGKELLGLICINHDISSIEIVDRNIQSLLKAFKIPGKYKNSGMTETLDNSIEGISSTLIHSTILAVAAPGRPMHTSEKEKIILELNKRGVFSTRGAVKQVADELNISEPTVYRYLRKIKDNTD